MSSSFCPSMPTCRRICKPRYLSPPLLGPERLDKLCGRFLRVKQIHNLVETSWRDYFKWVGKRKKRGTKDRNTNYYLAISKTPGQSEEMFKSWGCLTRLNHVNSFGPFLHWLSAELCEMFMLNIPVLLVLKIYAITCKVTETNWIGVWAKSYFTMIQRCLKKRKQKLKSRITRDHLSSNTDMLLFRHAVRLKSTKESISWWNKRTLAE